MTVIVPPKQIKPLPCTGGRYPLTVDGIARRTCCAAHYWRIHPDAWLHVVPEPDR